jgi:membrane protease YdiL (CAAX protease family)
LNGGPAIEPGEDQPVPEADRSRPAGRSTFSLEGRPAAGLYLIGWLLSAVGAGLFLVAVQVGGSVGGVLLMGSLLLILIGFASAAGYQLVVRATRPAAAFRGPSPLLVFGVQVVLVNLVTIVLIVLHVPGTDDPVGFLITTLVLLAGYVSVVWLFGIRSGALTWRGLGIGDDHSAGRFATDIATGFTAMFIVAFAAALWAGLLAQLLGTDAPAVVPAPQSASGLVLVALGAGLIVPIGEEILFRGYSMTAWLRDLGPRSALIRSTVFFALVHIATITSATFIDGAKQALLVVAVIAPVGLTLGWLFLRRGLVASIAGHATFNLIGVLLMALARSISTG